MAVGQEDTGQRRAPERRRDGVEVRRHSDTRVDQGGRRSEKQIRIVPCRPRPLGRVSGRKRQDHAPYPPVENFRRIRNP
jgi:hypothetical protein